MANFQVGPQARVTVNSRRPTSSVQQVVITPLSSAQAASLNSAPTHPNRTISKVLIRAVESGKGKKDQGKTFALRNITPSLVQTRAQLKTLIKAQLDADVVHEFDVGYIQNNTVVSLRSPQDIQEVWASLLRGNSVTLWCDGLRAQCGKSARKRPSSRTTQEDSDDDEEVQTKKRKKSDERQENVEKTMKQLQSMHDKKYTQMQYRVWSEMYVGGVHADLNEAPTTPMFVRAGGVQPKKKSDSVSDVLTQAVTQLASALTPKPGPVPSRSHVGVTPQGNNSPAKVIENRSQCYKQLGEIKTLHESGLLSAHEYDSEREAIMSILKNLTC